MHELVQAGLSEVEGFIAEPLEVWRRQRIEKKRWDPALWLLLDDDEGLAGAALGERWDDGVGYVAQLAVAPRARGRGHGRTLLLSLFEAFRADGLRRAELSVHGANRGAARLYESVGMTASWEAQRWEKALGNSDPARLAELARADGRLGLDTEFMPEGRYRPLLCLVQIAAGGEIAVLDPLDGASTPGRWPPCSPIPRWRSSSTPAARTSRSCAASGRRTFTNVFDTQVAAGFAGFSAQAGYNGLLHDVLKIRLPKTASFTRWDARPLTEEQLRYARGDVEHLLALADEISAAGWTGAAGSSGRARSAVAIAEATDERDPEEVWRRLPRVTGLDSRDRAVARELAAWRERTARGGGPAGRLGPARPDRRRAGQAPAGRPPRAGPDPRREPGRRAPPRADDLIEAIARGQEAEPVQLDDGDRMPTESVDGPVIALAEALVRSRAQAAGLAYELIAARADLAPIVVAARRGAPEPDVRTLRGWRRELVGAELLELLAGRRTLAVGDGGRVQVSEA